MYHCCYLPSCSVLNLSHDSNYKTVIDLTTWSLGYKNSAESFMQFYNIKRVQGNNVFPHRVVEARKRPLMNARARRIVYHISLSTAAREQQLAREATPAWQNGNILSQRMLKIGWCTWKDVEIKIHTCILSGMLPCPPRWEWHASSQWATRQ